MSAGELPATLSRDAAKRALYGQDTYFQEGFDQLSDLDGDPVGFAHRFGLVLLKPDAVAARQLLPTVDWLTGSGFRVVSARRVPMVSTRVRSLWYFQWNCATSYRRRLADMIMTSADSLLLVVRATGDSPLPASVQVTAGKGPTDPAEREPGQLRYVLGRYNYALNLVHTADEPADVIRELAVYLDAADRAGVLAEARRGDDRRADAVELAERLHATSAAQDLHFAPAAERIRDRAQRLAGDPGLDPRARAELSRALSGSGDDRLRSILEVAWRHHVDLPSWDVVIVGSTVFPMKDRSRSNLIETVTAAAWDTATVSGPRPGP
jgi:nucleoside diphosphate kinase